MIGTPSWLTDVRWWWHRAMCRLRWWYCARMQGHDWAPIGIQQMHRFDDGSIAVAWTQCRRCKMMLTRRTFISWREEVGADADLWRYVTDRTVRELVADMVARGVPIVEGYDLWRYEMERDLYYNSFLKGIRR